MSILRSSYHYFLARLGSFVYKDPSSRLFVLGVTGTKGKSTVIELVNAILETAGKKTALLSSVRFKIDSIDRPNATGMTMPGRFAVQSFLAKAARQGCEYAIIEVTSQGVLQHRHRFINFDGALVTNLEPEHIEAHGSFEKYRASKAKFFYDAAHFSNKREKFFYINSGMRDSRYFVNAVAGKGNTIFYNRKDIAELKIKTTLIGEFNLENIAAAIAFARSQNIDWEVIRQAVETFNGVPGRLEFVQKFPFVVVIDYAHTPDSLEKVYQTLSNQELKNEDKKLICALGSAGGGRDAWKRPIMGKIAARYCDRIFLTNEDPFDENPEEIINQIEDGILDDNKMKVRKILDRKEAIRNAIKLAKKGDVVIITGKGCEPHMRLAKGKKIPWNEREVVLGILNEEKIEIE